MPISILTDEQISPQVAHRLVQDGFDVICVRDRSLLGWNDWELMDWCIQNGRAICTKNGPDFEREHARCLARGEEHPGVLILEEWPRDVIYWALRQFLEENDDPTLLMNQVVRLAQASPEFIRNRSGN